MWVSSIFVANYFLLWFSSFVHFIVKHTVLFCWKSSTLSVVIPFFFLFMTPNLCHYLTFRLWPCLLCFISFMLLPAWDIPKRDAQIWINLLLFFLLIFFRSERSQCLFSLTYVFYLCRWIFLFSIFIKHLACMRSCSSNMSTTELHFIIQLVCSSSSIFTSF